MTPPESRPIWLHNLEASLIPDQPYIDKWENLYDWIPHCSAWIDGNRIDGSEENRAIVEYVLWLYTEDVDWSMLAQSSTKNQVIQVDGVWKEVPPKTDRCNDFRHLVLRLKKLLRLS
jgi:hypothetical protein